MPVTGFPKIGDRVRVRPVGFPSATWLEGYMMAPTMPSGLWMCNVENKATHYYDISDYIIEKVKDMNEDSAENPKPGTEEFVVGPSHSLPQASATVYYRYVDAMDAAQEVSRITGENHVVYTREVTYRKAV